MEANLQTKLSFCFRKKAIVSKNIIPPYVKTTFAKSRHMLAHTIVFVKLALFGMTSSRSEQ